MPRFGIKGKSDKCTKRYIVHSATGAIAASVILCLPPAHLPKNLTGPQAPDIICAFPGPSHLQGYLAMSGNHRVIYYTAGPHAQVLFRGPLYGQDGTTLQPNLKIER